MEYDAKVWGKAILTAKVTYYHNHMVIMSYPHFSKVIHIIGIITIIEIRPVGLW